MRFFGILRAPERRKAWVNRLLENNPVPAIWISNSIDQIDPAFLHRFDFTSPLKTPPRRARERILKQYLGDLAVSDHWIRKVAENPAVAPALVSRAAHVATVVGDGTQAATEQQMERLLEHTLKAMGHNGKLIETRDPLIPYRLDVLNTDRVSVPWPPGCNAIPGAGCVFTVHRAPVKLRSGAMRLMSWTNRCWSNGLRIC